MASYGLEHCHLFLPSLLTVALSLPLHVSSLSLSAFSISQTDCPHQARTIDKSSSRLIFTHLSHEEVYIFDLIMVRAVVLTLSVLQNHPEDLLKYKVLGLRISDLGGVRIS